MPTSPTEPPTVGAPRGRPGELSPGDRLGRYTVTGEVGRGGMGVVYRAHDPGLGRDVAVKVLPPGLSRDAEAVARLRAEARAASALDHPHVCTVYEVGEAEPTGEPAGAPAAGAGHGRVFVAMALYHGEALDARLARGPLAVAEAVDVARQVALGLGAAHRKGVVHRDVKPSNVFLTTDVSPDGGPCVKLLDFGVAHVEGAPLTRPGTTLGTIGYAAPEQAHGEAGPAADQWGLGVTLYEMLAGRRPFDEPYEAALLYAVLNTDPPPLRALRPDVPEALDAAVHRLLAKRPQDRYATADEAAAALAAALSSPSAVPAASPPAPPTGGEPSASPAPAGPLRTGRTTWDGRRRAAGPKRIRAEARWRKAVPRRWRIGLASVAVLVAAAVGAWAAFGRSLPDEKHVAVLPFPAVGGGPGAEAFSVGLVETLASGLTQLEQYQGALWVVPASEVRAQNVESPSAARRVLGATLVVTGSVQRSGGRARVLLNLVDASTLRQVRSATVDVPEARLNTLSAEVAAALEEMLDLELRPEARARLAAGGTSSPEAFDALTQGVGFLDRGTDPADVGRAVALFERALSLDPGYALAHAHLGEAYVRRFTSTRDERWLVRAEAASREALGRAPETAAVHALLSKVARRRGGAPAARARARRAGARAPPTDPAPGARRRGDAPAALASARRAVALDPTSDAATVALGASYDLSGDAARAERTYRLAVRRKPGSWLARTVLGRYYFDHGRYADAEAVYREALPLAPDNTALLLNLGSSLYMLSLSEPARLAEARAVFERSLRVRPTYGALSNLGTLYYDEGRLADAARAYERALALDAADPLVWGNLALAYGDLGREADRLRATREGARRAEAQLRATPRDADLLVTLAGFYADLGRPADARRAATRAAALAPTVDAQVNLAYVFADVGDAAAARRWLRQAIAEGFPREEAERDSTLAPLLGGGGERPVP